MWHYIYSRILNRTNTHLFKVFWGISCEWNFDKNALLLVFMSILREKDIDHKCCAQQSLESILQYILYCNKFFYKQTCSVLTLGSTLLILILAKFFSFFLNQCFITASAQSGVNPSRDAGMGGAVLDIFTHSAHLHSPETDQRPVNKWLFVVRTRAFILSLSPLTAPLTSDRLCHNSALTAWAKSGRVSRSKWNSNRPCNLQCQLSPPVPFSWLLRSWPALTCLGCWGSEHLGQVWMNLHYKHSITRYIIPTSITRYLILTVYLQFL